MVKTLTRTGNSLALVLDRPLLESLRIDAETPLEISTDGDVLVVTPVRTDDRASRLKEASELMNERYAGVFRRLAE